MRKQFLLVIFLFMSQPLSAWGEAQADVALRVLHQQWTEEKIKYLQQPLGVPSILQFFVISLKRSTVYVVNKGLKIEFESEPSSSILATLTLSKDAIHIHQQSNVQKVDINQRGGLGPLQISENIWVTGFYNAKTDDGRLFLHDTAGKDLDLRRRFAYYPYDATFRVKAVFKRADKMTRIKYKTSRNQETELIRIGHLQFNIGDVSASIALDVGSLDISIINVMFEDLTSGSETYGNRDLFVELSKKVSDLEDGEEIVLDFNFAEHPLCARSSAFNCPIPQNSINAAVRAGEKNVSKHE